MRAYYYDNTTSDPRLPHETPGSSPLPPQTLARLGLDHWHIPVESHEDQIEAIARERGYKNRDVINVSKAGMGDAYEGKIKMFFEEHLHEDEEVRYVLDGSGYFDIRETPSEAWIRIHVEQGDLLVLPAGIYHRFTLTDRDYIKAMRLFQDEPKWTPHNRGQATDQNPFRKQYLSSIGSDV